jgi:acyl-coenzyme A thioesterase 13
MCVEPPVTELPNTFQRLTGYQIKHEGSEQIVIEVDIDEQCHLNRMGIVHGGMIATLLDAAAGQLRTQYFPPDKRQWVTLGINISFVSAARPGRLIATAHMIEAKKSVYFAHAEVRDASDKLIATATATFSYAGKSAGKK